ncbi:hypothetical protein [Solidesulfovibrio alcoholivorans]|uniref:hypothetical protein n=1 Tax=Solidesulfovibrio alcoholivorans TaxID=81406 RepID=UPI0012EB520F|nr:hypothetical protein [Solidesulfovibrio alcoholivorans]
MSILPDMALYRYLSLESFLHLFTSKKVRFSKITSWPDKFEGKSYEMSSRIHTGSRNINPNHIFGSCWTRELDILECHQTPAGLNLDTFQRANQELQQMGSAALWEAYCGRSGVCVKCNISKILCSIASRIENNPHLTLVHQEITYCPGISIRSNTIDALFQKRIPFRHESEYRFIILDNSETELDMDIDIGDIYDFFDEILVCPTQDDNGWITSAIHKHFSPLFKNGHLNMKNGKIYCHRSQLYLPASNELRVVK